MKLKFNAANKFVTCSLVLVRYHEIGMHHVVQEILLGLQVLCREKEICRRATYGVHKLFIRSLAPF